MEFVLIPPGKFLMGSMEGEGDERPLRCVTIGHSFYLGRFEVKQAEWKAVMGGNPSKYIGDDLPVQRVSWEMAHEFVEKLNGLNDGYTYRLPTEAEWEYACRAGTTTEFAFGTVIDTEQANFLRTPKDEGKGPAAPVMSFRPNAFGLYNMHGNVWEWCEDVWHYSYAGAPLDGSAWVSDGVPAYRVQRGGSWRVTEQDLRSANRGRRERTVGYPWYGVRVVAEWRQPTDRSF